MSAQRERKRNVDALARLRAPHQPLRAGQADRGARRANTGLSKAGSSSSPRTRTRGDQSPKVRAAIAAAVADVTRYPDGNGFALKQALAARFGVGLDQIVLGNGSNDVLRARDAGVPASGR